MGLWGKTATSGGYDPIYAAQVREASAQAITEAIADLQEVGEFIGHGGCLHLHGQWNLKPHLRLPRPQGGRPRMGGGFFATQLVKPLPLSLISAITPRFLVTEIWLTSDFPGPLRDMLETGVRYEASGYERDGYGGTSIFINGMVGGLMTFYG